MMKVVTWRFTQKNMCITLFLCLLFSIILCYLTPRYPEPIFYSIVDKDLSTPLGERINLKQLCADQDTLLIFFSDSSPTSIKQINALSQLDPILLQLLNVIFIHCGRMTQEIPELERENIYVLLDPETELARKMNIYTIPTIILVTQEGRQILFSQKLVTTSELISSIQRLKNQLP